jgi:transposase
MSHHRPTKDDVQRQTLEGHSKKEILRKLKRAIAREIYKLLTRQIAVPEYADLRPVRQAENITVTAAANHFGVWPNIISRIERGLQRDDTFARIYRTGSKPLDTNRSIKSISKLSTNTAAQA